MEPSLFMATPLETLSQSLSEIITQTHRSIVAVRGRRSAATGIHWHNGLIVTSAESLRSDDALKLRLPDGKSVKTELLGSDPTTDIAVLALPESIDIPTVLLGEANDLTLGQLVSTVGYSLQRGQSSGQFTSIGMVSQLGEGWRSQLGGQIDRYIEVSLNLRRGSAGCPLINASGQVVGFNTFGSRHRVLVIPSETINPIVQQLEQRGKLSRGYLGLGMQAIPLDGNVREQHSLTNKAGIMVVSVDSDSAAYQAGLLIGDVMVAVNEVSLESLKQIQAFLGPQSVGQVLSIKLMRGGKIQTIDVTVGER